MSNVNQVIKAEKRKVINNAIPAKDKAPISLTSPARIRSKILSLNSLKNDLIIENNELKNQVAQLQNELQTDSLPISKELDADLKSIFKNNDKKCHPLCNCFGVNSKNICTHRHPTKELDITLLLFDISCQLQLTLQLPMTKCGMMRRITLVY